MQRSEENMAEYHLRTLDKVQTRFDRSKRTNTQQTTMKGYHTQCYQWRRSTYTSVVTTRLTAIRCALRNVSQSDNHLFIGEVTTKIENYSLGYLWERNEYRVKC